MYGKMVFKVLATLFMLFILTACGGGSSDGNSDGENNGGQSNTGAGNQNNVCYNNSSVYCVSFYDINLDFIDIIPIVRDSVIIPSDVKSGSWYKAGESIIANSHALTGHINFYKEKDVIEITDQIGLDNVRNNPKGKYILLNDISLNENGAGFDKVYGWKSISSHLSFSGGIFNGNGYKITNLWIYRPSTEGYSGLFSSVDGYVIKNLGVEISDKGIKSGNSVGAIAGFISGAIINSYSTGNISGNNNVGGIAGWMNDCTITNSYSAANVNGNEYVGGIAGWISWGTVENGYSIGNISGNNDIGGIVGRLGSSIHGTHWLVSNSYSSGNINGNNNIGGIVGTSSGVGVCASTCKIIIQNNAAINPSIRGINYVNRIVGYFEDRESIVLNNIAREALSLGFSNFTNTNAHSGISVSDSDFSKKSTYIIDLKWKFGNDDDNPWVLDKFKDYSYPTFYWQMKRP
ncbi:MAG: hypothetical protein LBT96_01075 [Campylobacteraceae bacterium]|nr:hypothetical protein [Campylobacteraceae bacterium]